MWPIEYSVNYTVSTSILYDLVWFHFMQMFLRKMGMHAVFLRKNRVRGWRKTCCLLAYCLKAVLVCYATPISKWWERLPHLWVCHCLRESSPCDLEQYGKKDHHYYSRPITNSNWTPLHAESNFYFGLEICNSAQFLTNLLTFWLNCCKLSTFYWLSIWFSIWLKTWLSI